MFFHIDQGFSTAKGELVRGILYPKQGTTQLHADMIRCMKMFFMLGFPCMIYTAIVFSTYHVSNLDLAIIVIDIGTFLVPPLLPSVLTSVNVHAQKRLHKQQIFCLNSAYINAGGTVDVVCFDKTGTLTEDSLDFEGALPTVHNNHSKSLWSRLLCPESLSSIAESTPKSQTSPSIAPYFGPVTRALDQISLNPFQLTLATCHSLVQLNHEIIGEPLELRLFERLKWTLLAPDQSQQWWRAFGRPVERVLQRDLNAFELQSCGLVRKISDPRPTAGNDNLGQSARLLLAVLRQFPFESALQRMSVVVQAAIHHPNDSADFCSTGSNGKRRASLEEHRPEHASNDVLVLMKGSPENVTTFCLDNSFPADLSDRVRYYTGQGYRVLACASRTVRLLPGQRVDQTPRHELEQQMHFDGLLLFHNRVKPTSASTVEQLQDARIRAVMVTGDNLLTAVHVARECNIVKSHLQLLQVKAEMLGTDANGNHATTLSDNHHTAEGNQFDQESDTWSHVQLRSIEATKSFAKPDSKMKITYTLLKTIDVAEKTAVMVTMPYSTNGSETTKNGEQKIDISSDSSWSDESSHLSTKSPDLPYQLCADGRTVRLLMQHAPDLWSAFLEQGAVFARVSPTQKAEIVENLQFLAHRVAMVGDGANDCAALRQADCGLSLSGEQSAMAAAFSTQTGSVQALIPLLSECRAALAATCGAFKYQVGYCFVLLSAVMLMFWDGVFTSDGGYVIVDIVLNIAPPLLFGSTRAARRLHRKPPTGRLFAGRTLASVFSFVGWQTLLYFSVRALVQSQSWYEQPIVNPRSIKKSEPSHLALAILSVNMASYVIAAIIFAPGPPHRRPLHTNRLYLSLVAVNAAIVLFISLYPAPAWLLAYVNFRDVPDFGFKVTLLLINLVNFGLSYTWEVWALQKLLNSFERHFSFGKRERKPFERVQQHLLDLQSSGSWPPNLQARC